MPLPSCDLWSIKSQRDSTSIKKAFVSSWRAESAETLCATLHHLPPGRKLGRVHDIIQYHCDSIFCGFVVYFFDFFYECDEDEAVAFWLNYVDKLVCYPSVLLGWNGTEHCWPCFILTAERLRDGNDLIVQRLWFSDRSLLLRLVSCASIIARKDILFFLFHSFPLLPRLSCLNFSTIASVLEWQFIDRRVRNCDGSRNYLHGHNGAPVVQLKPLHSPIDPTFFCDRVKWMVGGGWSRTSRLCCDVVSKILGIGEVL